MGRNLLKDFVMKDSDLVIIQQVLDQILMELEKMEIVGISNLIHNLEGFIMHEYFSTQIKGKDFKGYLLWYSDDKDGVLIEGEKLLVFATKESLYIYAQKAGLPLKDENTYFDLCPLEDWLNAPNVEVNCRSIWNFCSDIFYSVGRSFSGDSDEGITLDVYNKLFYGCNFPALRGDGELYIPKWYDDEIELIAAVLTEGLDLLRELIKG